MKREPERGVRRRRAAIATLTLAALAVAVALGAASTASSGTAASTAKCGDVPAAAPKDPQNLLKGLPANIRATYQGYPATISKSPWASWKPKGDPPYTVGIAWNYLGNTWQTYVFNRLQKYLRKAKLIGNVIAYSSPERTSAAGQIQQYQSLVQQGADIIILQPLSSASLVAPVEAAAKQGIPTVGTISQLETMYSVDVVPNAFLVPASALAAYLKVLNHKGNLLGVHGIRTTALDLDTWTAFKAVLALCPDVKLLGEVDGNFAPPSVKAGVLQFLATNQGQVDGVIQTTIMAPSIIGAFQQAGRSVPPVLELGAQKASVAFWSQNRSKGYTTAGSGGGGTAIAHLLTRVVTRMLAGQGAKLSEIIWDQPVITSDNLSQFANPAWTTDTPGTVENPPSYSIKDKDLNKLFNHPERKTGGF